MVEKLITIATLNKILESPTVSLRDQLELYVEELEEEFEEQEALFEMDDGA